MKKKKHKIRIKQRATRVSQTKARGVKNKLNQYICQICGGSIVTVELADGIAPPVIACQVSDACSGTMTSAFYHVPRALEPDFEFFRPAPNSIKDEKTLAYIRNDGLLLRPIKKKDKIRDLLFKHEPAVVMLKIPSSGETVAFTFDAREIQAMKAGDPLDWQRITNGAILPDASRLPSRIRRAVLAKLLENFQF